MDTNKILIKDARIANLNEKNSSICDIFISHGIIAGIAPSSKKAFEAEEYDSEVIDAYGNYVLPAFVDMHTHLRDPGFDYKEDIITGTNAAMLGGFGAVLSMPNTAPVTDSPDTVKYTIEKARNAGYCTVYPTAAITKNQKSEELVDFDALTEAGAVAFTDDGRPVTDAGLMREAMKICAARDYLIISHSEELSLTGKGVINEGKISKMLGVAGIPNSSEDVAVAREIVLAEETGCRLHIAHVSTKGAVQLIREAKKRGVRVTAETCPHYFVLSDEDVVFYGVNAKMKPPLRTKNDVNAVIRGFSDGTIDCISTDHAPHSSADKGKNLADGAFGIIGLQTAFALSYTYLVLGGYIDIYRLIELMSFSPAKIARIDKFGHGALKIGGRADLVISDCESEFTFNENYIVSKSKNSPFIGMNMTGRIDAVIHGGNIKYKR